MGRSQDQILVTLREICPELTVNESKPEPPAEGSLDHALILNNEALQHRQQKRFDEAAACLAKAIEIEDRLLDPRHPKRAHRRNNLAIVYLLSGDLALADAASREAWTLKGPEHDMTSGRILFARCALAFARGEPATPWLGQLRTLLGREELPCLGNIAAKWDASDILDSLRERLSPDQVNLLAAIFDALNDHPAKVATLDTLPLWRNSPAVTLETPWPERERGEGR
jgi:tetratricopeptide (TPR) repeat protein